MQRVKSKKEEGPLNNLQSTTLRPGLLVSGRTRVTGNVTYIRELIEADHVEKKDGSKRAKWETTRIIAEPKEWDAAVKLQSKLGGMIRQVCVRSDFGLLCPNNRIRELNEVIGEARKQADEFTRKAKITRVSVFVITGRIEPNDREAVRAINSEVTGLMAIMEEGIKNLDVKRIREAAARAKQLGGMLPEEMSERMGKAISAARDAAKKIVKAGEAAVAEVDKEALKKIKQARTAFLDLDDAAPTPQKIKAPRKTARAIEIQAEAA